MVHAGAVLVLSFLIGKLQYLISSCSKAIKRLIFLRSYTTSSIPKKKAIWKAKIGSRRSTFGPFFPNWQITRPYKLLLKNNWKITFLKKRDNIICFKKKKKELQRWKLVHAGAPLVLFFYIIRKMQDLTISCLELFKKLLF